MARVGRVKGTPAGGDRPPRGTRPLATHVQPPGHRWAAPQATCRSGRPPPAARDVEGRCVDEARGACIAVLDRRLWARRTQDHISSLHEPEHVATDRVDPIQLLSVLRRGQLRHRVYELREVSGRLRGARPLQQARHPGSTVAEGYAKASAARGDQLFDSLVLDGDDGRTASTAARMVAAVSGVGDRCPFARRV